MFKTWVVRIIPHYGSNIVVIVKAPDKEIAEELAIREATIRDINNKFVVDDTTEYAGNILLLGGLNGDEDAFETI